MSKVKEKQLIQSGKKYSALKYSQKIDLSRDLLSPKRTSQARLKLTAI